MSINELQAFEALSGFLRSASSKTPELKLVEFVERLRNERSSEEWTSWRDVQQQVVTDSNQRWRLTAPLLRSLSQDQSDEVLLRFLEMHIDQLGALDITSFEEFVSTESRNVLEDIDVPGDQGEWEEWLRCVDEVLKTQPTRA